MLIFYNKQKPGTLADKQQTRNCCIFKIMMADKKNQAVGLWNCRDLQIVENPGNSGYYTCIIVKTGIDFNIKFSLLPRQKPRDSTHFLLYTRPRQYPIKVQYYIYVLVFVCMCIVLCPRLGE